MGSALQGLPTLPFSLHSSSLSLPLSFMCRFLFSLPICSAPCIPPTILSPLPPPLLFTLALPSFAPPPPSHTPPHTHTHTSMTCYIRDLHSYKGTIGDREMPFSD